jgi:hypothetical protein
METGLGNLLNEGIPEQMTSRTVNSTFSRHVADAPPTGFLVYTSKNTLNPDGNRTAWFARLIPKRQALHFLESEVHKTLP